MRGQDNRLDVYVDVFHEKNQWARVLPDITPVEFIEAILQEFRQARMEFLGDDPSGYFLARAKNLTSLDPDLPLAKQVEPEERLVLMEQSASIPSGAEPLPLDKALYLRELSTNRVFRIQWLPAIIGRPDPTRPDNELLAVNLRDFETGLRVSRRHAQILNIHDRFFIKSLSQNPTRLLREHHPQHLLITNQPTELRNGDIILLERSQIMLKVIIRDALLVTPLQDESQESANSEEAASDQAEELTGPDTEKED